MQANSASCMWRAPANPMLLGVAELISLTKFTLLIGEGLLQKETFDKFVDFVNGCLLGSCRAPMQVFVPSNVNTLLCVLKDLENMKMTVIQQRKFEELVNSPQQGRLVSTCSCSATNPATEAASHV